MCGGHHLRIESLLTLMLLGGVVAWSADLPDPPAPPRRSLSWFTGVLVAELPKFVPHPPAEAVESTIAAETAVERNGVLSLPTMRVRPVMKESPSDYAFLTAKGRIELAMKTYPGLKIGNLLGLNQIVAMAKQQEEMEVRAKARLYHQVERVLLDDSADTRETRLMLEAALGRANASWLKNYPDR